MRSRAHYIVANVGPVFFLLFFFVWVLGDASPRLLLWYMPVGIFAVIVQGWFWYPRAKRKLQNRS